MDPAHLLPEDLVRVLKAAGSREISSQRIQADIEAGAPCNPDGTIHLVRYAAWLVKEGAHGG